jgi:alkylhydroperoxidase family enzyme
LRNAGFTECDIRDIATVADFFSMSNRVAAATDMGPNTVHHSQAR